MYDAIRDKYDKINRCGMKMLIKLKEFKNQDENRKEDMDENGIEYESPRLD